MANGLASAIAKLHWEPHQRELMALLEVNDGAEARIIAPILLRRPAGLDFGFPLRPFRSRASQRTACLLRALEPCCLHRPDAQGVAVCVIQIPRPPCVGRAARICGRPPPGFAPEKTAPLLARLSDDNEYVAAAASRHALGQINATNAAAGALGEFGAATAKSGSDRGGIAQSKWKPCAIFP